MPHDRDVTLCAARVRLCDIEVGGAGTEHDH